LLFKIQALFLCTDNILEVVNYQLIVSNNEALHEDSLKFTAHISSLFHYMNQKQYQYTKESSQLQQI